MSPLRLLNRTADQSALYVNITCIHIACTTHTRGSTEPLNEIPIHLSSDEARDHIVMK